MIVEIHSEQGEILTNQIDIRRYLTETYANRFQHSLVAKDERLLEVLPLMFQDKDNELMGVRPTEKEVEDTVMAMSADSSLGLDGFSGIFFKSCWHIIKVDITRCTIFL